MHILKKGRPATAQKFVVFVFLMYMYVEVEI